MVMRKIKKNEDKMLRMIGMKEKLRMIKLKRKGRLWRE